MLSTESGISTTNIFVIFANADALIIVTGTPPILLGIIKFVPAYVDLLIVITPFEVVYVNSEGKTSSCHLAYKVILPNELE